ncbi:conserved protein of unknown function [Bradyrhizobium sp. ORS 285]|uniref:hypothetical protein n=1 Tax=Bradyrhizobium sp. ORS 285 TaxID=115808 RepID=UPI0002407E08|nr:hypothetical protein [Bradyrhizobium sp. ORS 285]CCD84468.1 conserved hypothetical protein [Bradyrhizobium sp. ORS 285]SMX57267.1 conserved protein of unknown function [Bradyrhizobium sp. ORS 285]
MRLRLAITTLAFVAAAGVASAQHHGHHGHGSDGPPKADARERVAFPPEMTEHTLANMRDHLLALQEINDALAAGETDQAGGIAEQRLGMTSLRLHGAAEVAKFMPQGMQDAGTAMHKAASRFAIAAQDAGVTGDLKPALKALGETMAACVGCHAGYRLK